MRNSDTNEGRLFRSGSRFYQLNGSWFYATREGEHGPFDTREDAETDARLYAGLHSHLEHARDKASWPVRGLATGLAASTGVRIPLCQL